MIRWLTIRWLRLRLLCEELERAHCVARFGHPRPGHDRRIAALEARLYKLALPDILTRSTT